MWKTLLSLLGFLPALFVCPSLVAQPALAIGDASIVEGDSGTNLLAFTVALSAPATNTVTVNYVSFNGTAMGGSDFVPNSGTLSFAPGVTNQVIEIGVRGETLYETNETFGVLLQTPVNATISRNAAIGMILNDDPAPLVSISDASMLEDDSGTNNLAFQVRLSKQTGLRILVTCATSNGTAIAGSDYLPVNRVLSFAANSLNLTQTINVPIVADILFEPDEVFYVSLTSISNAPAGRVQARAQSPTRSARSQWRRHYDC